MGPTEKELLAIWTLGRLRADESASLLVSMIDWKAPPVEVPEAIARHSPPIPPVEPRWQQYPAARALADIGLSSVTAIVEHVDRCRDPDKIGVTKMSLYL